MATDTKGVVLDKLNGGIDSAMKVVEKTMEIMAERITKLEDCNRDAAHRVLGGVNDIKQMTAVLVALQQGKLSSQESKT